MRCETLQTHHKLSFDVKPLAPTSTPFLLSVATEFSIDGLWGYLLAESTNFKFVVRDEDGTD
jgi:hypothetical protein